MITHTWFDGIPLPVLFFTTLLLVMIAVEAGRRLAMRWRQNTGPEGVAPVGSAVGGVLALLAFLLAFTFGIAASRFDTRRELLLTEVNAIGTCFLRAGFLPQAERHELRVRLQQYASLRSEIASQPSRVPQILKRSDELLDEMWDIAEPLARENPLSEINALLISSLNEVIDLHTKRLVVGNYHIPIAIWLALYLASLLAMMGVGYLFGCTRTQDLAISLLLATTFSLVICLIADLDRIDSGWLRVNQAPMLQLRSKLDASES